MSDEARLAKPNSPARKPWFEHNYDQHNGPDCHGPSPEHRKALRQMLVEKQSGNTFVTEAKLVTEEALNLLVRKQNDYGPLNISRAPGGPLNGLRVRIFDKISRINNLIDTGATPENESLRDSFIDLANYGLIALMVLDGVWPELPEEKK